MFWQLMQEAMDNIEPANTWGLIVPDQKKPDLIVACGPENKTWVNCPRPKADSIVVCGADNKITNQC